MLDNYELDVFGVLHQIEFEPIKYDQEYISYYEDLNDRTIRLGYQRMGWVLGLLDRMPDSMLEIGYGLGTFIEAAQITGVPTCVGCDITQYPLPANVEFMDWGNSLQQAWDVVAMFDVLEHIPDLGFLESLNAKHLAIAVPYCRWRELGDQGDDWFRTWRMLLPNEHLHHFDQESLVGFLAHYGYRCDSLNTFEDGIRLREGETGPNVLSGFFTKT